MREYLKERNYGWENLKRKRSFSRKTWASKDVILDIPKIIVMGRNEITIENHKGIQIFEKNKIKN